MHAKTKSWLNTPPAQWSQRLRSRAAGNTADVTREIERVMQRGAMLAAYLDARAAGSEHVAAVKAANRKLVRVRRAMGFSYPESMTFTPRELATLRAALLAWQIRNVPDIPERNASAIEAVAASDGPACDAEEIDSMLQKLSQP